MKIKDIIKSISDSELGNKEELVAALSTEISSRNDEAKQHRVKYEAATSMIDDFRDHVGVPEDIDNDGLGDYLIDKKAEGSKGDKEFAKLQKKFSKLEGLFEAEKQEKEQLKVTTLNGVRDNDITSILSKSKVRPEAIDNLKKMFGSISEYDADEGWQYEGEGLKEGIGKYLDNNSWLLTTGQKEGTGATGSKKSVGQSEFTYQQVLSMSPSERAQNKKAIQKSMKGPNWSN